MPEETNSAPDAQQPRPLRRALLVAGLSVVSAAALGIWLVGPMMQRRHDRSELYAVGACRAYAETQSAYRRNDWDMDGTLAYAHPYMELSKHQKDMDAMISITGFEDWASRAILSIEGVSERGYLLQDMQTLAGKPIDWTTDFALCATPAKYGGARRRTFIVSTDGTVWGKDLNKSEFVSDFPADPAAAGWHIAE